jgi:hypothetical protein
MGVTWIVLPLWEKGPNLRSPFPSNSPLNPCRKSVKAERSKGPDLSGRRPPSALGWGEKRLLKTELEMNKPLVGIQELAFLDIDKRFNNCNK